MIPVELQNMKPLQGNESLPRDADYMGAVDIDKGTEPVLTIAHLYNGEITLTAGRKEKKKVITFVEERVKGINEVRPLVLNRVNWKTLRKLYGSLTAETLEGKQIQLYLQPGVRNPGTKEVGDGIRIREKVPTGKVYQAPKCEDCGAVIAGMSNFTPEQLAAGSRQKYGRCLCVSCGKKAKAAMEAAEAKKAEAEASAPVNDLAAQLMAEAEK